MNALTFQQIRASNGSRPAKHKPAATLAAQVAFQAGEVLQTVASHPAIRHPGHRAASRLVIGRLYLALDLLAQVEDVDVEDCARATRSTNTPLHQGTPKCSATPGHSTAEACDARAQPKPSPPPRKPLATSERSKPLQLFHRSYCRETQT